MTQPELLPDGYGLYVHVPFCRTACPYCDFDFVVVPRAPEGPYAEAVVREWSAWKDRLGLPPPETVFFGGGTPSMLSPESVARILAAVFPTGVPDGGEVSLEANPRATDRKHFAGYRKVGVNRLSLGVQSFSPLGLKRLGRGHRPQDARLAVDQARSAGFENLSLDLIFGWPGQTLQDWARDLEEAVAWGPQHLSAYGLTLEEGTAFWRLRAAGRLSLPEEGLQAQMLRTARRTLSAARFEPYEISNYARPGFQSRHNLGYWTGRPYLGLGAAAHSFFPGGVDAVPSPGGPPSEATAVRWWNVSDPAQYVGRVGGAPRSAGAAIEGSERLGPRELAEESLLLGLRLSKGLDWQASHRRWGVPNLENMRILQEKSLVRTEGRSLKLTEEGVIFADEVVRALL